MVPRCEDCVRLIPGQRLVAGVVGLFVLANGLAMAQRQPGLAAPEKRPPGKKGRAARTPAASNGDAARVFVTPVRKPRPGSPAASPRAVLPLQVRVSRTETGEFEPIDVTVENAGSAGAGARPVLVMAQRGAGALRLALHPGNRPGEWRGRFTPLRAGVYSGEIVTRRGPGMVTSRLPDLRVRSSPLLGLVRIGPPGRRVLRYGRGGAFFPIGVRLPASSLHSVTSWRAEIIKLRAHGANYLELPVSWPVATAPADRASALQAVDFFLRALERKGSPTVQLRLEGPPGAGTARDGGNAEKTRSRAYEAQVLQWVRRWSYSPVIAAWYLAGAGESFPAAARARLVRAVRAADPYGHLVAVPGPLADRGGADLAVMAWSLKRPTAQGVILEGEDAAQPAPGSVGAGSWRMLVTGGLGLPLWGYDPGAPGSEQVLQRVALLEEIASRVPYHAPAELVRKMVGKEGADGLFYRYGRATVGWVRPRNEESLALPALDRPGRLRVWDAGRSRKLSEEAVPPGKAVRLALPAGVTELFIELAPDS